MYPETANLCHRQSFYQVLNHPNAIEIWIFRLIRMQIQINMSTGYDSHPHVHWITAKMLWFHSLVGVSHFAEFLQEKWRVNVWFIT